MVDSPATGSRFLWPAWTLAEREVSVFARDTA